MKVNWLKMASQTVDLPGISNVAFDEAGNADVPQDIAINLCSVFGDLGFEIRDKVVFKNEDNNIPSGMNLGEGATISIENTPPEPIEVQEEQSEEDKVQDLVESQEEQQQDDLLSVIEDKSTTVAKLQEIADQFPKEEWEGMKKAELRDYLIEKFNLKQED